MRRSEWKQFVEKTGFKDPDNPSPSASAVKTKEVPTENGNHYRLVTPRKSLTFPEPMKMDNQYDSPIGPTGREKPTTIREKVNGFVNAHLNKASILEAGKRGFTAYKKNAAHVRKERGDDLYNVDPLDIATHTTKPKSSSKRKHSNKQYIVVKPTHHKKKKNKRSNKHTNQQRVDALGYMLY